MTFPKLFLNDPSRPAFRQNNNLTTKKDIQNIITGNRTLDPLEANLSKDILSKVYKALILAWLSKRLPLDETHKNNLSQSIHNILKQCVFVQPRNTYRSFLENTLKKLNGSSIITENNISGIMKI